MAGIVCDDLDRIMAGNTLISEIWAGNVLVYQYDSTAPALTVTAPAGTASGSPTYYTSGTTYRAQGTVSDAESGVSAVYVNGSAAVLSGNTWYKDITVAANTTVTVQVYAVDKAGNRSATITRYVRYDSAAPSLAVTTPAGTASGSPTYTTGASYTVSGTVSDASGIRSVTVNGSAASVSSGKWSKTLSLTANTTTTVTVVATDNAGRTTTVTRYVRYDSAAPSLAVTTPAGTASGSPTYTTGASYTVSGTVSDASGIRSVTVNGSAASVSSGKWSKTLSLTANTTTTVTVVATDNAGRTTTVTRYVRYDSAAPSLAVTTPANNAVVTSANVTVSGTASDASGLRSLTVNGVAVSVAANGTWSRTITLGGTGANTITVIVTDNAGRTTTVTRTVVYMFKDSDIVIPVYVKGVAKDGYNTSNSWSTGIVQIPESHTVYYITGSQYVYIHVTFFSAVICKVVMNEGQMTPSGTLGGVPHPVIGQITGTGWWRFKIPAANGYARLGIYVFTNPLLSINNDSYIQPWVGSANLGVRFSPFTVSGNNYSGGQITIDKIVTVSY